MCRCALSFQGIILRVRVPIFASECPHSPTASSVQGVRALEPEPWSGEGECHRGELRENEGAENSLNSHVFETGPRQWHHSAGHRRTSFKALQALNSFQGPQRHRRHVHGSGTCCPEACATGPLRAEGPTHQRHAAPAANDHAREGTKVRFCNAWPQRNATRRPSTRRDATRHDATRDMRRDPRPTTRDVRNATRDPRRATRDNVARASM